MTNLFFHKATWLTIFLLAMVTVSCSSNHAQRQFERDSSGPTQNYTHMDTHGKSNGAKDPDDWRISPMFQGVVDIQIPPYPNPVSTNQQLTIQLYISGLESVYGINIYVRTNNPQPRRIYSNPSSPLPTGITTIKLNPSTITPTGNPDDATGLQRIFIYDNNNNLITYGDIMIQ